MGLSWAFATAIIAIGIMVATAFGPEKRGRRFESAVARVDEAPVKQVDLDAGDDDKAEDERTELADQRK